MFLRPLHIAFTVTIALVILAGGYTDTTRERNESLSLFVRGALFAREKQRTPEGKAYADDLDTLWLRGFDACFTGTHISELSGSLDILVLIDRNGQAVDVTVLQDTSYAKCLSDFSKHFRTRSRRALTRREST